MYRTVNLGNRCVITKNDVMLLDSELEQKNSFSEEEARRLCDELNGGKDYIRDQDIVWPVDRSGF